MHHNLLPRCNKSPPRHQAFREGRPIHDLQAKQHKHSHLFTQHLCSPRCWSICDGYNDQDQGDDVDLKETSSHVCMAKHPTTVTAQKNSQRAPASSKTSIWSSSAALASKLSEGKTLRFLCGKIPVFAWPIE